MGDTGVHPTNVCLGISVGARGVGVQRRGQCLPNGVAGAASVETVAFELSPER